MGLPLDFTRGHPSVPCVRPAVWRTRAGDPSWLSADHEDKDVRSWTSPRAGVTSLAYRSVERTFNEKDEYNRKPGCRPGCDRPDWERHRIPIFVHMATSYQCNGCAEDGVWCLYYSDVIMGDMASQITSLTIVYSTVFQDADQRNHQSSASLAFVRGIHRWPVNSPHKWPVTRKLFPLDDVIMLCGHDLALSAEPSTRRL